MCFGYIAHPLRQSAHAPNFEPAIKPCLFAKRQRLRLYIGHRRDRAELQAGLHGGESGTVAFFGQVEVAFVAAGAQEQCSGEGGE